MKKPLLSAALSLFVAATTLAQTTPTTTSDGDKTKTTADGTTVKTKMANDGKMKVKSKDEAGNRMKASTKPRRGDTSTPAGKMHHKGMKMKKGMRMDSTRMPSGSTN